MLGRSSLSLIHKETKAPKLPNKTKYSICLETYRLPAAMVHYPHWYVKHCIISACPPSKVIFISFDLRQNIFGKLGTVGFIVPL
jgi:hypothetical protein